MKNIIKAIYENDTAMWVIALTVLLIGSMIFWAGALGVLVVTTN